MKIFDYEMEDRDIGQKHANDLERARSEQAPDGDQFKNGARRSSYISFFHREIQNAGKF
jgi:hypothetical protein